MVSATTAGKAALTLIAGTLLSAAQASQTAEVALTQAPVAVPSQLADSSPRAESGRVYNDHIVRLSTDQRVVVQANSTQFDPILEIYDAVNSSLLVQDDDGGEGFNSRLILDLGANRTYRIRVLSFSRDGRGEYELIITPSAPLPPFLELPPEEQAGAWRVVRGAVPAREEGSDTYFVDYRLPMTQGDEVVLAARSETAAITLEVLTLSQRDQEPLAVDFDDAWDGRSAIAFVASETGDYIVRVRVFGINGENYRLGIGRFPSLQETAE